MSWTVFLPGHWPTLNALNDAKANHHAYHKLKMSWQGPAALLFRAARIPLQECVRLRYVHRRKARRGDKGNLAAATQKIVEDAMVDAGVIPDDSWGHIEGFSHEFVIDPREGVEVTIEPVT